jgi:hypothetical protein
LEPLTMMIPGPGFMAFPPLLVVVYVDGVREKRGNVKAAA